MTAEERRRRTHTALVIERFEPSGGGVEAVAWQVAQRLAAAGEKVEVFARSAARGARVPVRALRTPSSWQPLRLFWFSRAARRATAGYAVVHSFSRTRHQHIYRAGGGSHADYMERAYGPRGARLRRASPRHAAILAIETAVFRDSGQIVQCNSEMVRDQLQERYAIRPERLVVIPNGVDLERFGRPREAAERTATRRALGVPEQALAFLLIGHGFRRKGLDTALAALARCKLEDAWLWVAGRDDAAPWRARAEQLGVGSRVAFLGHRDPAPLYSAADALLLPTRYDAFANVCLEAAAAGCPVITSGQNGAARWLGDAGICVADAEDVDGFAAALGTLADGARRSALARAGRARAETASWDQHVAQLRALYDRVRGR